MGHTASRSVKTSDVENGDYLLHTLTLFAKNPSTRTLELELSGRKAFSTHLVLEWTANPVNGINCYIPHILHTKID